MNEKSLSKKSFSIKLSGDHPQFADERDFLSNGNISNDEIIVHRPFTTVELASFDLIGLDNDATDYLYDIIVRAQHDLIFSADLGELTEWLSRALIFNEWSPLPYTPLPEDGLAVIEGLYRAAGKSNNTRFLQNFRDAASTYFHSILPLLDTLSVEVLITAIHLVGILSLTQYATELLNLVEGKRSLAAKKWMEFTVKSEVVRVIAGMAVPLASNDGLIRWLTTCLSIPEHAASAFQGLSEAFPHHATDYYLSAAASLCSDNRLETLNAISSVMVSNYLGKTPGSASQLFREIFSSNGIFAEKIAGSLLLLIFEGHMAPVSVEFFENIAAFNEGGTPVVAVLAAPGELSRRMLLSEALAVECELMENSMFLQSQDFSSADNSDILASQFAEEMEAIA